MNAFHRWYCRTSHWREEVGRRVPWAIEGLNLGPELLEVGAGPGLVTDYLRAGTSRLTAVELDHPLASSLGHRLQHTNVRVVQADGTKLPFADESFTGAVCFTMLHHVPSPDLQNELLREVHRVLRAGGVFAGSDSQWSRFMQLIHIADTLVPVDPSTFGDRLADAGFSRIDVSTNGRTFRFQAQRT